MRLLLLLFVLPLVLSQPPAPPSPSPATAPTLLQSLIPIFLPLNPAGRAVVPITTRAFETPLVIRLIYLFSIAKYEIAAACHPKALSFFGVRDHILPQLCEPLPVAKIFAFTVYQIYRPSFKPEAAIWREYLESLGLNPDVSNDETTERGVATRFAKRANRYLVNDGWNSLGDRARSANKQPYADYTAYLPLNLAQQPVQKLRAPLRWQPLTLPQTAPGSSVSQVHIVPQLSIARPLALTLRELREKRVKSPYTSPNRRRTLSPKDEAFVRKEISKYFAINRALTPLQRALSYFWENKLVSLGSFLQVYSRALGLSQFEEDVLFMSEMVAQHDALLVAWKEKLRHDLVRPTTIITRLLGKKLIRAFIPSSLKVQKIPADEYETFIRTQPHSEFPSASAVLCSATFENLRTGLEAKFGANLTVPPFVFPVPPNTLRSIPIEVPVTIRFDNLQEATSSCAQSRLWAGVHFEPSIVAGVQLGRGVGKRAFEHISAIAAGIRPKNCVRCL